jgi:hypothetical protein
MKKITTTLVFMAFSLFVFSQSAFTEQTLNDIHQAFIANPPKAVAERTSPNYMMIGSTGQTRDYAGFKALNESGGLVEWPISEVKIQSVGNLAIATGITNHKPKGAKTALHERFTETYEFQNGQWKLASAHYTDIVPKKADEEAAIKKLLVDERNAFYTNDKESMEKLWKNDPKAFVSASYPNGNQFSMDNERIQKYISDLKLPSSGAIGTITDSKVHVYGNNAVATLELTTTHKNGGISKEHDIVLLEKEGETWKVLGYSVHGLPKDSKEEEAAIKAVIEKETQSWHNRDAETRISCIANVPYALMLVHHGVMASNNGVAYVTNEKKNAPEAIKTQTASMGKPNGTTFKNENYVVTIKGGTAFVSYDEITTAADGTKQYGHAVRNLEKIDGFWKLTYIGGVIYKP